MEKLQNIQCHKDLEGDFQDLLLLQMVGLYLILHAQLANQTNNDWALLEFLQNHLIQTIYF